MGRKTFEYLDWNQQLNLIEVVEHLVCDEKPQNATRRVQETLGEIVKLSKVFAARCTNYVYPDEPKIEPKIITDIHNLAHLAYGVGAKTLIIPMSRFPQLNDVFARAMAANQAASWVDIKLADGPAEHPRFGNPKKSEKSMLGENVRGIWYFWEHREVA